MLEVDQIPGYEPVPFVEATMVAVSQVVKKVYNWRNPNSSDIPFVYDVNNNPLKALEYLDGGPTKLPLLSGVLQSIGLDPESYNPAALQRTGVKAALADTQNEYITLHLRPIVLTIEVTLMSQNYNESIQFALAWSELCDTMGALVRLNNPVYEIPVKMLGARDVPIATSKDDDTQSFKTTVSLSVKTYTGWMELIPSLKSVVMNTVPLTSKQMHEAVIQRHGRVYLPDPGLFTQFQIDIRS